MSPYITEVTDTFESQSGELQDVFPHLHEDPSTLPRSLDPFTITTSSGFMPLQTPEVDLPPTFDALKKIMFDYAVVKEDGTSGLLATYQLGPVIDSGALPDFTADIDALVTDDGLPDLVLVTAAFRDYGFLASSYLLEPCWERFNKGLEGYGLGRQTLPRCIAGPLVKTASMLNVHPFLAYAAGYALFNYKFANAAVGAQEYSNLRLIRAFEHGHDPLSAEAGFILTHVDMVKHSAGLIKGTAGVLDGIGATNDRREVVDSLETLLATMRVIEASMENMWAQSRPKDYVSFRCFIFGITNQSMFPDGVIYEGENNNAPLSFRGESGANDAMIPLLDGLLEIPMPENPLTAILRDFRSYRPRPHREFLTCVRKRAAALGVREYCGAALETRVLYLRMLDHVRSFRWRHWLFAREYILRHTKHPTATGGSPIVTWLPNQLFAVMDLMKETWDGVTDDERQTVPRFVHEMMDAAQDQRDKLHKEVLKWCSEREAKASQA